ncbi:MAG: PilZ domain-containing protein [Deltaproteobacteria bacterium]|nr:PilZ domain-containing protein [Deltaproteobacteria bacterium]
MTNESRAHPRYAIELDAEVTLGDTLVPARTRDVSRGGLCFFTQAPLPLGGDVDLNLALVFDEQTFSEPLRVRARVVWCTQLGESKYQVGTSFYRLTSETRAYLEMFLRYLTEGIARQEEEAAATDDGAETPKELGDVDEDFG